MQAMGPGVKKPGDLVQSVRLDDSAVHTGTTTIPGDDTIPQNTEGDQYLSQAVTPASSPNILRVRYSLNANNSAASTQVAAIFRDSTANALQTSATEIPTVNRLNHSIYGETQVLANQNTSTTFAVRSGGSAAGTTTINGVTGSRSFGGVFNSYLVIDEYQG